MFSVELTVKIDGRSVTVDEFVQLLLATVQRAGKAGTQEAIQPKELPIPVHGALGHQAVDQGHGRMPLAVGVKEAASLFGVCRRFGQRGNKPGARYDAESKVVV
jgi:hypothetical protein